MQIILRVARREALGAAAMKQVAFATANAMNRTMEEAQTAQRQGLYSSFAFRGTDTFFSRMVKIRREDRARKDRLRARIRIEGPEGDEAKGTLLARHERGGVRSTGAGGFSADVNYRLKGHFYLPTRQLRASRMMAIPRRLYPANLRLLERRNVDGSTLAPTMHRTRSGKNQLKGKQRTFVLFSNTGEPWGIFQRVAGGPRYAHDKRGRVVARRQLGDRDPNIRKLWTFKRSIALKPRLHFERRVTRVIHERYPVNFRGFLSHALRTAR